MRLQLTRRADYAIRTVMCLGREGRERRLPVSVIAARMEVPRRFLPQIMQDLVAAGLVQASIGRGGGYRLARGPGRISLLEVIEAVEGNARRRTCVLSSGACDPSGPCDVHHLFAQAQDALLERLAGATVLDALGPHAPSARSVAHPAVTGPAEPTSAREGSPG
jgi:Rrf2 family transcriptional regulator, iron-sulfur cluster assembly transcription factor